MSRMIDIDPKKLIPHEKTHLVNLIIQILKTLLIGKIKKPILIDKSKVVLDGHHRRMVAIIFGFKSIKAIEVDYLSDESIKVYPRRKNFFVSKKLIIERALSKKLFPPKTTKHIYG